MIKVEVIIEKTGENIVVIEKIRTDEKYDQVRNQMHALIDLGFDNLSPEQDALLDHFASLIEAYDQEQDAD